MSEEQKAREAEVFNQELSLEDLDAAAGGYDPYQAAARDIATLINNADKKDTAEKPDCSRYDIRQIYGGGGFPNCAATVEDGSWCGSSDACVYIAIDYKGMTDCKKAWR